MRLLHSSRPCEALSTSAISSVPPIYYLTSFHKIHVLNRSDHLCLFLFHSYLNWTRWEIGFWRITINQPNSTWPRVWNGVLPHYVLVWDGDFHPKPACATICTLWMPLLIFWGCIFCFPPWIHMLLWWLWMYNCSILGLMKKQTWW